MVTRAGYLSLFLAALSARDIPAMIGLLRENKVHFVYNEKLEGRRASEMIAAGPARRCWPEQRAQRDVRGRGGRRDVRLDNAPQPRAGASAACRAGRRGARSSLVLSAAAVNVMITSLSGGFATDVYGFMFGSVLATSRADPAAACAISSAASPPAWRSPSRWTSPAGRPAAVAANIAVMIAARVYNRITGARPRGYIEQDGERL